MKYFILLIFLCHTVAAQVTPVQDLGLQNNNVEVPQKFSAAFPTGKQLKLPAGYKVRVFYAGGLNKPRFMAMSPAGVLHVSDLNSAGNGKIYALPDTNHDGIADTAIVVSQGYTNNHDIRFYKGSMYVTESLKVWKCTDGDGDGIYETKTLFIDNVGSGVTGGHSTRTLAFDAARGKVYVSIGSSCNVCRESSRAIIEEYNEDGTGKRTYATGIRNAVGMAMHPVTGRLWANNNGSDNQGNEIPHEWIDLVRDGGFYGHPFAYGNKQWFDFTAHSDYAALLPITALDSAKVNSMLLPAAQVRAHSAPMALHFLDAAFPPPYSHGFLTALRGSWNTTMPNDFRGYKLVYGHLSSAQDTTVDYIAEFCTGFLTDSVNRVFWGRPVGIATDQQGAIYLSSDETNKFILQIYPDAASGTNENQPVLLDALAVYPNPATNAVSLAFELRVPAQVTAELYDLTGRLVYTLIDNEQLAAGAHTRSVSLGATGNGIYLLKMNVGGETVTKKVYRTR